MIQTFFPRHLSSPVSPSFSPYAIRSHKNDFQLRFLLVPCPIRFLLQKASTGRTAASQRHIRLSYPAAILIQGTAARLDVLHGVCRGVPAPGAELSPAPRAAIVCRGAPAVVAAARIHSASHVRPSAAGTTPPLRETLKSLPVIAHVLPYSGHCPA